MNSSSPSKIMAAGDKPGRTRRFGRWVWRRVWSRGMAWTLVVLVSLIVLYYRFENWRSARELTVARKRMIERLGTDTLEVYAAPRIPDEQNYFCIPVIQSWAVPHPKDLSPFSGYATPEDLIPKDFILPEIKGEDGGDRMDLKGWAEKRAAAGKPLAPGESAAQVMDRELGDAHGILTQLVSGLDRPYCCFKPGQRESIDAAGGDAWQMKIPSVTRLNQFWRALALHFRVAARAGNARKAQDTAMVALRFCEGSASWGCLISSLVAMAGNGLTFLPLNDALACPIWDDASLTRLQRQLAKTDDLETVEHALGDQVIWGYECGLWMRNERGHAREWDIFGISHYESPPWWVRLGAIAQRMVIQYGPIGWHDANIAYFTNGTLEMIGPNGDLNWLDAYARCNKIQEAARRNHSGWRALNPRTSIGAYAVPSLGNIYGTAALCLFQRRSLIIACALERYRITHGAFPPSLAEVAGELKAYRVNDPARPDQPLGYRLEEKGYLLWSAGKDAKDDGGDPEKDWLWRMTRD